MWIKHLTRAFCFVVASVYAQRTQPTRTPTTPTSLITPAIPPAVIGQEGCLSTILSQPIIQSPNSTFIVVTKRGRGRSFRDRHPDLLSSTTIQSDGSARDLPLITVVTQQQAELVRKRCQ